VKLSRHTVPLKRVREARIVYTIAGERLTFDRRGIPEREDRKRMPSKNQTTFYRWDSMKKERVSDMLERRLITGERMMLAQVYLKKGCIVPKHSHENEQLTYILEGALKFSLGEDGAEEITVSAGEVLLIPSNVPHKAEALEETLDVDIFSPPRQDWLDKKDDYLRR